MQLWDQTIEGQADVVASLPVEALYPLAFAVIEQTIPIFDPPFEEFFPEVVREVIESTLAKIREAEPGFRFQRYDVEADFAERDSIGAVSLIPGTGAFLVAIGRLVEAMVGTIDSDDVLEIMSACYEAIVMSSLSGKESLDKEMNSERCVAAIRMQQRLIQERVAA